MGINSKASGVMPEWKHGHFSLLFDGAPTPATLLFVDHVKQRYFDLTKERKQSQPSMDHEVRPGGDTLEYWYKGLVGGAWSGPGVSDGL